MSYADDCFENGVRNYESGYYSEALRQFETAARSGHHGAEYMLGYMYYNGRGVSKNYTTATHWFQLSAEGGDPDGELAFGLSCLYGEGIEENYMRALFWIQRAAAAGAPGADEVLRKIR